MKEQKERKEKKKKKKKKEDLGMQNAGTEKKQTLIVLLPTAPNHVVTINRFKVLLSSMTCLPFYPIGRKYFPYFPTPHPHPVYLPFPISQ